VTVITNFQLTFLFQSIWTRITLGNILHDMFCLHIMWIYTSCTGNPWRHRIQCPIFFCLGKCVLLITRGVQNLYFTPSSRFSLLTLKQVLDIFTTVFNPLNPELNPICYLLALLGAHHFLHVSRIRVKLLTLRRLILYIYGAPIFDVSRSHTTTQHIR